MAGGALKGVVVATPLLDAVVYLIFIFLTAVFPFGSLGVQGWRCLWQRGGGSLGMKDFLLADLWLARGEAIDGAVLVVVGLVVGVALVALVVLEGGLCCWEVGESVEWGCDWIRYYIPISTN